MNTVTHYLVAASVDRHVRRRNRDRPHPIRTPWFLFGGVAPDIPLILMTIGAAVWYPVRHGWDLGRTLGHVFRDLYFENAAWKAVNNLLQAPFLLLTAFVVAVLARRRWPGPGGAALWFVAGAALHVAFDIPLHHDDGPLILFPFDWEARFRSPVSYWDPRHYGDVVRPIEYVFAGAMTVYLVWPWARRRWGRLRDQRRLSSHN